MGHEGRERAAPGGGARPPMTSPNWTRRGGGAAPLSLSLSLSFPSPSPILVGLGKGSPTPTGRRTPPPLARLSRPAGLPLAPLYTGAGGHPKDRQVDP